MGPIVIAGIIILVIGAVNITSNESIKPSSNSAFTFAGLRNLALKNNNQNHETMCATTGFCTSKSISTEKGRLSCEKACKPAKCCYEEGTKCSPKKKKKNICDDEKYQPCMILGITKEIKKKEKDTKDKKDTKDTKDKKNKQNKSKSKKCGK